MLPLTEAANLRVVGEEKSERASELHAHDERWVRIARIKKSVAAGERMVAGACPQRPIGRWPAEPAAHYFSRGSLIVSSSLISRQHEIFARMGARHPRLTTLWAGAGGPWKACRPLDSNGSRLTSWGSDPAAIMRMTTPTGCWDRSFARQKGLVKASGRDGSGLCA